MSSLIRIMRTETGRKIINLAKVSAIEIQDKSIECTFDSKVYGMDTQTICYDTHVEATKAFDDIYKDLTSYYKTKTKRKGKTLFNP